MEQATDIAAELFTPEDHNRNGSPSPGEQAKF
jgi:hypothetical protein